MLLEDTLRKQRGAASALDTLCVDSFEMCVDCLEMCVDLS